MDLVLVLRRGLIAVVFDAPGSMEDLIPGELRDTRRPVGKNSVRRGVGRSARDEQKLAGWIDNARPCGDVTGLSVVRKRTSRGDQCIRDVYC